MTDVISDDNNNVCSISQRLQVFRNQEKFQNIDVENDGQVQGVQTCNLRHSTEMFDFVIGDLFSEYLLPGRTRLRKHVTHEHTHK